MLRAEFNPTNGALTRLLHKQAQWEMLRRPELGLSFRMEVPLPERHLHHINGEQQPLTSYTVTAAGDGVTFVWDRLTSQYGGEHAIGFTGTVTLTDDGLVFQGQVRNHSELTVDVVAYPCLGDVTPSRSDTTLQQTALGGNAHMGQSLLYPEMWQGAGYWGVEHLYQVSASTPGNPCLLLLEPKQGLYIGAHTVEPQQMVKWVFERKPGQLDSYSNLLSNDDTISGHVVALEMMLQHFTFASPGQTAELAPIVMQPYLGDWHAGLDLYQAWKQTWYTAPKLPAWANDVHAWLQIQINGAEDNLNFRYTDLPTIARDCKAHGIAAIQLTGWAWGGQDRGNPSHDTDPKLGTTDELCEAIRICQDEIGVKIILFTKWTWYDESQPQYREEGIHHVALDPYGNPYPGGGYQYHTWKQLANINTRRLISTCTASPAWRKVALEEFKKVVNTGAAGMLFDECQHHGHATYCFSTAHAHPHPAFLYGYDNVMMREFKQYSEQVNPDFLYGGEDCYEFEMLEYHLPYTRFGRGWDTPGRRYASPFQPILMAVTGFDDRNQLNKCLQHRYLISYEPFQFKGRPSDAPLTMAYGRKIDDLRRRYRAYLWDATFRHTLGATVLVDGKPHEDYSVFTRDDGKRALIIANTGNDTSIEASVAFDSNAGLLMLVDPEHPEPRNTGTTVHIAPRSVAVILEQ